VTGRPVKELLGRGRTSRLWVRFGRYSIGSVIAVACSEVAFVLCFGPAGLGTTIATVVAFVAGAVPNYLINRFWAWGGRDRPRRTRETVLYVVVILASLVVSIGATAIADHLTKNVARGHAAETLLVSLAYLAIQAVLFVLKFAAFQKLVFTDTNSPAAAQS
jgi:putative flippase GtrA